jgi:5-formyltetrahydrofolate cyclo-ligase
MLKLNKKEIRNQIRLKLSTQSSEYLAEASSKIVDRLLNFTETECPQINHILAWLPFFPAEVDLTLFINSVIKNFSIYLPQIVPANSNQLEKMQFVKIENTWISNLAGGVCKIPEPITGELYNIINAKETLVILPGLAFDFQGGRLGRGKGHYDKFLASPHMQEALKLGVAYECQVLLEALPMEQHDISLDWLCTENKLVRIKS